MTLRALIFLIGVVFGAAGMMLVMGVQKPYRIEFSPAYTEQTLKQLLDGLDCSQTSPRLR